jgi:hypothetical protein
MTERGVRLMKIDITSVKSARICLFHFDGMLAKRTLRAYIAYAEDNNSPPCQLGAFKHSYDIPNSLLAYLNIILPGKCCPLRGFESITKS